MSGNLRGESYDLIVVGSGPGGEGAAMQAAKDGLKVLVVEKFRQVGGACTHLGTIPSKALRHAAHRFITFQTDPLYQNYFEHNQVSFQDFLQSSRKVISSQVERRQSHYFRNNIKVHHGRARLVSRNNVLIEDGSGSQIEVFGTNIVIATGSRPYRPEGVDFTHPRIFDSDTILDLSFAPKKITIIGAGIIGCEYTCIFKSLGTKVSLINNREKLLNYLDTEITDALSYYLRDQGVMIRHNELMEQVESKDDAVIVTLSSGIQIKTDLLLIAQGRSGNTEDMGLAELGVDLDLRGNIKVNNRYQTSVDNIYAVGDITGFPSLASAAYDQGRFAARHMQDPFCDMRLVKDIPIAIYTSPEISCIGKTEYQLTQEKVPYEVGHVSFKHLARAQITGQSAGMLKILFHCDTLEILGIHCIGQNSAEIIHIGQAIMAQPAPCNTINYFINTTFNYPTMAEAYRVAALNGMNRLYAR